jgi:flagellar biosynthesis protein FliR
MDSGGADCRTCAHRHVGCGFCIWPLSGKLSPQLPVLFVGLSVKSVLGMLVMIATMVAWPRFFSLQFANAIRWSEQALHLKA